MSEEQQRQGFDPFYTSKELGNGMGLAIVHGIIMAHEGAINLQSTPGQGTTMELLLPIAGASAETEKPVVRSEGRTGKQLQILLVDDQSEVLNTAEAMIGKIGHHCIALSSPRQAMETIRQKADELDLVITDFSMPEFTGRDILEFCNSNYPELPVIISTGFGEKVAEAADWQARPLCILDKPYHLDELRQAIAKCRTSDER
jgi:CheY-like chemotaxis protein